MDPKFFCHFVMLQKMLWKLISHLHKGPWDIANWRTYDNIEHLTCVLNTSLACVWEVYTELSYWYNKWVALLYLRTISVCCNSLTVSNHIKQNQFIIIKYIGLIRALSTTLLIFLSPCCITLSCYFSKSF